MLSEELLLQNGYKRYDKWILKKSADCFFQKRVKDEQGQTKYFIVFFKYRHDEGDTYECDLQFEKDECILNLTLFNFKNDLDLTKIETLIERMWLDLYCKYYD